MVAVREAEPPSEANTGPNFSVKVMLILVYWILGSMGTGTGMGNRRPIEGGDKERESTSASASERDRDRQIEGE